MNQENDKQNNDKHNTSVSPQGHSLFVSAGDPSGDIAGFHFLERFAKRNPSVKVFGLGGERMRQCGQEQLVAGEKLAALGFWEVAKKYPFFRKLFHQTLTEIDNRKPAAALLIDYPGFNLRLARQLKKRGVPVIFYISPQVWAWGAGRIKEMREVIDELLLILPFEVDFFAEHQVKSKYVGHYLLDDIAPEILQKPYNEASKIIALLPGSRQQEIDRMLPTMLEAARKLGLDKWDFRICGRSAGLDYEPVLSAFSEFRDKLVIDKTRETVAESALVISSSGTATLETALIGRPLIVLYKTGALTYAIAKHLVKLPHIALANIVAGASVAPEFIQGAANANSIADCANDLLSAPGKREEMVSSFLEVRERLHLGADVSPSDRVAKIVSEYYTA